MLRCHAHTQDRVVVAEVARLLALPSKEPFVLARVAVDRKDLGTRESHEFAGHRKLCKQLRDAKPTSRVSISETWEPASCVSICEAYANCVNNCKQSKPANCATTSEASELPSWVSTCASS